jgi:ATP-binding cassette, subfamily C, bacterial LapB
MNGLFFSLWRLSRLLGQSLDKVALTDAVSHATASSTSLEQQIDAALAHLRVVSAVWRSLDEPMQLPGLVIDGQSRAGVLRTRNAKGEWVAEFPSADGVNWAEEVLSAPQDCRVCSVQFARPRQADHRPVMAVIREALLSNRKPLLEVVLGGIMINLVALATSLYSMQVYDRVIPTGAQETLLALTIGVVFAVLFEFVAKLVRASLNERVADVVDARLARAVYSRFLDVRLDQLPASVGALAAQLKGYETIRSFLVTIPTQLMVDVPFILLYTLIVVVLGGWLGLVSLFFMVAALALGFYSRRKVQLLTQKSNQASNLKTGLLVETVEGAETIKSGQGGWRMLTQWLRTADDARLTELDMRNLSEHTTYMIATMHQLAYAVMVAWGALMVAGGHLTMGGLIACTILSGRILGPISTLPGILVQWGHFRAALDSLSRIWALEGDHHDVEHPVVLDQVRGEFDFAGVEFRYGQQPALKIPALHIREGDKVGILGPIGSGKTTLLRLLSGMYKPYLGTVRFDGVDISHISKPVLAESVGYLQQDGRLFAGTLRDNLLLGLVDPGDSAVLEMTKLSGLYERLVGVHPKGLNLPIFEGGTGLSGGQKQLVNLTRVFLRRPKVWLLDEPTASMDRNLEVKVLQALESQLRPENTLCLVTHKPELLRLVNRVIVVVGHQIVMDGPRDEVLQKLQGAPVAPQRVNATHGRIAEVKS